MGSIKTWTINGAIWRFRWCNFQKGMVNGIPHSSRTLPISPWSTFKHLWRDVIHRIKGLQMVELSSTRWQIQLEFGVINSTLHILLHQFYDHRHQSSSSWQAWIPPNINHQYCANFDFAKLLSGFELELMGGMGGLTPQFPMFIPLWPSQPSQPLSSWCVADLPSSFFTIVNPAYCCKIRWMSDLKPNEF